MCTSDIGILLANASFQERLRTEIQSHTRTGKCLSSNLVETGYDSFSWQAPCVELPWIIRHGCDTISPNRGISCRSALIRYSYGASTCCHLFLWALYKKKKPSKTLDFTEKQPILSVLLILLSPVIG